MLPAVRKTSIAAIAALSVALSGAALPANALGRNERNVLKGIAAAVIVGAIANDIRRNDRRRATPEPVYNPPTYYAPTHEQPRAHAPRYEQPRAHRDDRPRGRVIGNAASSVYATPAARVFNSYSAAERRQIQRKLASYGYYRGSIDGSFGPGTYGAVEAFARREGRTDLLSSNGGVYAIYDSLVL